MKQPKQNRNKDFIAWKYLWRLRDMIYLCKLVDNLINILSSLQITNQLFCQSHITSETKILEPRSIVLAFCPFIVNTIRFWIYCINDMDERMLARLQLNESASSKRMNLLVGGKKPRWKVDTTIQCNIYSR